MHIKTIREICKFLSGFVAADFVAALWLYIHSNLPVSILGVEFSERGIMLAMVFDVIVFAILVHYGWRIKDQATSSSQRTFLRFIGTVFGILALLHLLRLIFGWPINILSWHAPYWISVIGTIVAAFISFTSFRLIKKS